MLTPTTNCGRLAPMTYRVTNSPTRSTPKTAWPSTTQTPSLAQIQTRLRMWRLSRRTALSLSWFFVSTLNSDHLPTAINFDKDSPPASSRPSFTNFRRADWEAFKRESERLFAHVPFPSSCSQGEKDWRRVIQRESTKHIPCGFAWAESNEMSISAPKSSATLFTPWTKQVNLQLDVKIDDVVVPT